MTSIVFYAGPDDNVALRDKIDSLGLTVFETEFKAPGVLETASPGRFSGCITFLDAEQLHPYAGPAKPFPYRLSGVTDPIVDWLPSYSLEHRGDRFVIHGHLIWEFDMRGRDDEAKLGKRHFGMLSRWIRKNWPPPVKGGICRGPHAQKMIQFEGYIPRGLPPDVKVEYIKI